MYLQSSRALVNHGLEEKQVRDQYQHLQVSRSVTKVATHIRIQKVHNLKKFAEKNDKNDTPMLGHAVPKMSCLERSDVSPSGTIAYTEVTD